MFITLIGELFYCGRIIIRMQTNTIPQSGLGKFQGTGGFLNPDKIALEFGLKEGMNAADFGCGAGYFTVLMAKFVGETGKVTALDVQESPLDSVMVKAKAAGIENVQTVRSNLEVLGSSKLRDESQDIVLLANILFQSVKKELIIREAVRVTKKNGMLIIIDWEKGGNGFGPPDYLRLDEESMKSVAVGEGLIFERNIDAGAFHYGLIFRK